MTGLAVRHRPQQPGALHTGTGQGAGARGTLGTRVSSMCPIEITWTMLAQDTFLMAKLVTDHSRTAMLLSVQDSRGLSGKERLWAVGACGSFWDVGCVRS